MIILNEALGLPIKKEILHVSQHFNELYNSYEANMIVLKTNVIEQILQNEEFKT